MDTNISRRKWISIMLASLPAPLASEIKGAPENFKIVSGRMGDNSCQYLYGADDECLAYSVAWWKGEWAMVHEMTLSRPPTVLVRNAQTILELIDRELLLADQGSEHSENVPT